MTLTSEPAVTPPALSFSSRADSPTKPGRDPGPFVVATPRRLSGCLHPLDVTASVGELRGPSSVLGPRFKLSNASAGSRTRFNPILCELGLPFAARLKLSYRDSPSRTVVGSSLGHPK